MLSGNLSKLGLIEMAYVGIDFDRHFCFSWLLDLDN